MRKIIPIFIFGICFLLMFFIEANASMLVKEEIDNVYFTRTGGGDPYLSVKYNTYTMDGKVVYCIEPSIGVSVNTYIENEGLINSPYSDEMNNKIQLIGNYGYDYPGHKTFNYRLATQELIWEYVSDYEVDFYTEKDSKGEKIDIEKEKEEIMKLVDSHYKKPSFDNSVVEAIIGNEFSISDTSNVLSSYEVLNSNNAKIKGNTLYINMDKVGTTEIKLIKKKYDNDVTLIYLGSDGKSQKMGYFRTSDDLFSTIKVKTKAGNVTVEKLDSKTLGIEPMGDATLKGAVYGIYNEKNEKVTEVQINSSSLGISKDVLTLGRYYIKEEKASKGYTLDNNIYWFEITKDNLNPKVKVYEKVIERKIEIFKVFADSKTAILKAEANVQFDFYLKSNMQLYESKTTDENGKLTVTLPYGIYVVKQITAPPGYEKVQDFEIIVDETSDDIITKIISNSQLSAKLKLIKVDSDSNKILVRDGIKFKIKNLDTGEYVCQNITYPKQEKICTFETTDGTFTTPYSLIIGNYQIEEIENQTINGYLWNPNPLKFSINENSKFIYDEQFGLILEIKFENKEVKGEVEVTKIGEEKVIEDGIYYYDEIKLDGVIYELYAGDDIYSQVGELIYKKDDLIGKYETKDGYFKIEDLYLGKYYLVEVFTPKGHILDTEKHYFELSYKDQYTPIVSLNLKFKNYLEKGTLEFSKKDFVTGESLPNTKIQIYTYDEDESDSLLVYEGYTDLNGNITIKDLFVGKYYIIETQAPVGYNLNNEKMYFEIKTNGEIIKADMKDEKIIEVPDTLKNEDYKLEITSSFLGVIGILSIIYGKRKKEN